jgi:hypothetical protein
VANLAGKGLFWTRRFRQRAGNPECADGAPMTMTQLAALKGVPK